MKTMIQKLTLALLFGCLFPAVSYGQDSLQRMTLEDCVAQAIDANFGLKISGLQTQQAENNVTIAPFVPTVSGTARQNQTGVTRTQNDKASNTLSAGLSLSWRLFDGLGMFATHDRQRVQLSVSQLQMRDQLETLVSDVMKQYYLLISLHSQLELTRESMEFSQERYEEALLRVDIGSSAKPEMLLAKIDLNADSSSLIRQEETLRIAYIEMNRLTNIPLLNNDYVQDSILMGGLLLKPDLTQWAEENNVSILLAQAGIKVSDLDLKLARAARYPTLDFAAGYNINGSDANNFQGNFRNSNGVNWGFNMGVNLFNGLETNRRVRNAKLDQSIREISLLDTELEIMTELDRLYLNYINNIQMISFEQDNAELARQNMELALLRYKVGDLSGIDFRNIQQQYLAAVNRKINVIYQAKISEVMLLTLAGQL